MRVQTYVAAGALVLAGGAIAWGATRVSDTGIIHSCVDVAYPNTMHLAPASGACGTSQTLLEWNVQGPQGPPGTPGTPGSTGDVFANGKLPLRVLLPVPGSYSVTAGAEISRFFATPVNHNVLVAKCTLAEPRVKLPAKVLRVQLLRAPANYTGNFTEPISMNAIVFRGSGGMGGVKSIVSVDFNCFFYNAKLIKVTVSNPSLSAIFLGGQ